MSNYNSLSENEKHEFECLLAQLTVETPMRPLNGFQGPTLQKLFNLTDCALTNNLILLLDFRC